jgi:DNA repair photolyase
MQYNIRLDGETREKVVAKREVTGIPISKVVDEGLRQYLSLKPYVPKNRNRHNDQMTISHVDPALADQLRDAGVNVAEAIRRILREWVKEEEENV